MPFRIDRSDAVAVLTFDRPPVNAFDLDFVRRLESTLAALAAELPSGLVVTGSGRAFSAGVDTRAFMAAPPEHRAELIRGITRTVAILYGLPFPVVAAVGGHAMGGGFVVMLACDYRLGVEDPGLRMGLQEAKAGIPFPAGPLEVIRAELSPELLRRLTLTSEAVTPAEMHARGVIDRLVPREDLVAEAREAVRSLASQPGFALVKAQLRRETQRRLDALARSGEDPLIKALDPR